MSFRWGFDFLFNQSAHFELTVSKPLFLGVLILQVAESIRADPC